ncbi:4'-phosphopantetheinyl transferase superfamily protein, partial [Streptomyces sp. NPDC005827]|uniref:4'-phosphopantetheinyl transferase superfamily protein n=1 Tax=Streptomyces sp. NPDC005827 TaxID=3157070 RepID=UPI003411E2DD
RLLHALSADDSTALWFTRFWAAKEAVAKAEGSGFGGRPRDFRVREAAADRLVVSGRLADAYPVRCERTTNPDGLPERDYVVAWTTGPTPEKEYDR